MPPSEVPTQTSASLKQANGGEADPQRVNGAPSIQAVLFDLDGTLVDTAGEMALALERTCDELGVTALSLEEVKNLIGRGLASLLRRALAGTRAQDADTNFVLTRFEVHYTATVATAAQLYPGVHAAFDLLRAHGVVLGVVTNKPRAFTQRLLERFDLRQQLTVVVAGDDGLPKKPAPDMIEAACQAIGVPVRNTLFLGDSDNDVTAARRAGCRVWCVPYGYNEGRPVEALACDRLMPTVLAAAHALTHSAARGARTGGADGSLTASR